jgi:hypothetical protein
MSAPETLREQLARLVEDAPTDPGRLAAVRQRAHHIRRRRIAATAALVAVLAVIAVLTTRLYWTSHLEPITPTGLPTGVLLVDRQGHVLVIPNLGSGRVVTEPGVRLRAHSDVLAASRGRSITVDAHGNLVVIDPRHGTVPRLLVPWNGSAFDVPGVGPRAIYGTVLVERGEQRIWLPTFPVGTLEEKAFLQPTELVPLDLDGKPDGRPTWLGRGPGVLAVGRAGVYIWNVTGSKFSLDRVDFNGQEHGNPTYDVSVGYVGSNSIVLRRPTCQHVQCSVFIYDADTGRITKISDTSPRGSLLFSTTRVSPDGRYLATALDLSGDQRPCGWAVVDLRTGAVAPVDASIHPGGVNVRDDAGWSGDRLVWVSSTRHGSVVGGYDPMTGDSATSHVSQTDLRVLGALP